MDLEYRCKECKCEEYTEEDIIEEHKYTIDKIVRSITHREFKKIKMYKDVYRYTKGVVLDYTKKNFILGKLDHILTDSISEIEIDKILMVIDDYIIEKYGPLIFMRFFEIVNYEFGVSLIESIAVKMTSDIIREIDRLSKLVIDRCKE